MPKIAKQTRIDHRSNELKTDKSDVFFYLLIRSWNSFNNFDRCIDSVFAQTYHNFKVLYVDDCSNYSSKQKKYIKQKLKNHTVVFNKKKKWSIRNAYEITHKFAKNEDAVIFNLDGDDYLSNTNALRIVAKAYKESDCIYTYGNCTMEFENTKEATSASRFDTYANTPYTTYEKNNNLFRKVPFRPLHPRTWSVKAFKKIPKKTFLDHNREWLRYCEDMAIFFPLIEKYPTRVRTISEKLSTYVISRKNDAKLRLAETVRDEVFIRKFQSGKK